MTTTVVVAVDDFTMSVENDDPRTPEWLLAMALMTQEQARLNRPRLEQAIADATIFGVGSFKMELP